MKIYGPFLKIYGPFETFFWSLLNGTKGQFWICWRGHGEEKQELFPCHWLHLICIGLLLWLVEIPSLLTLKLLQGRLCIWSCSFWIFWIFVFEIFYFCCRLNLFFIIFLKFWFLIYDRILVLLMLVALVSQNGSIICIPVSGFLRAYLNKNSLSEKISGCFKMNNNHHRNDS